MMSNCDAISPDLAKMIQDMIKEDMGNRIISRISVPIKTVPKLIEDDIVEDLDRNDRISISR